MSFCKSSDFVYKDFLNYSIGGLEMSNSGTIKYLLGIDGGGTKTEFLLTDMNKNEIKRLILGASNPVNIGVDNAKSVLTEGITQICADKDFSEISLFAGLAGGTSENIKAEISLFLSNLGFGAFDNGGDTDNIIETALEGRDGAAVIMGTGTVAFGIYGGARHRVGGYGYLIDKGCSGFRFGSDALDSAFKALDGRGGSRLILQLVEEKTGRPLSECVADIYGGGASYIASFAPAVFEAYKNGDNEAKKIIGRNSEEAALIIRTACDFSRCKSAVICGGLCRQKDILMPFLAKHLGRGYSLSFSSEPAVNGAVSLAKKIAEEKHAEN